jgi:hypothetical protein
MSKCNFTIRFSGAAENVISKARSAIQNQGGNFNGDLSGGSFNVNVLGSISGSYTISGQEMNISIDSKPIFIGCGQIESFMKGQFGG